MIGEWFFIQLFFPEPLLPLPLMKRFDNYSIFWRLVYSAVIWACLFCLYTTITAQVATCMLTIHDCIILKLDITWFTCVINKTKHRVYLSKFKMAALCTHCIFGFKTRVLGIVFTNNDVMYAILVKKWSINESFVRF